MPEKETFDLDAAFRALEHDIAGASSPRGAGAAIASARRRRRTTLGAIAAAVVLAVGGVVVAHGTTGNHAVGPADGGLPQPRPLDATVLTAATAGWTPAWEKATTAQLGQIRDLPTPCLDRVAGGVVPQPARAGHVFLRSGQALALAAFVDFGQDDAHATTMWQSMTSGAASCTGARLSEEYTSGHAEGIRYTFASADTAAPDHLWLVRVGDQLGMVWIGNTADPMPSATSDRVTEAMFAAVRSPDSYTGRSDGSVSSGSGSASASASPAGGGTPPSYGFLDSAAFAQAVHGWSSGWSPDGGTKDATTLPCDATGRGSYGEGTNLGGNGDQEIYGYGSTQDATDDVHAISQKLAACTAASYHVRTVTLSDGRQVTVAAAPGDQGAVVWLVQQGHMVMFVVIPAGQTPPPDSVSQAVGALMYDRLDHRQAGGGTPVQLGKPVPPRPASQAPTH